MSFGAFKVALMIIVLYQLQLLFLACRKNLKNNRVHDFTPSTTHGPHPRF